MSKNTKERIKDRILKRAAKLWGYPEAEAETAFDPLVSLLLASCAAELESIYGEIKASNARVLDRLLEVMTTENGGGVLPARTVLHAMPVESNFTFQPTNQFYVNHKIPNKYDPGNPLEKQIFFGPTGSFSLVNAAVKYVALDNKLFHTLNYQNKAVLAHAEPNQYLKPSNLWVGVAADKKMEILQKPMFYFHVRNEEHKEIFYHYLKQVKLSANNYPLKLRSGYNSSEDGTFDIEGIIKNNYNAMSKVYAQVNAFYSNKFMTLDEEIDLKKYHEDKESTYPREFVDVFEEKVLEKLEEDIVWLKFEFPPSLINEIIEDVQLALNCFPVINKQLESVNQKVNPFLNILPLSSENSFLDVKSVYDTEGNFYDQKAYDGNEESNENVAIVRNGSVGRFDSRNASELLQHLLETLKDESASYAALGGDFLAAKVRKLNQIIASLEQNSEESQLSRSAVPYIMLNLAKDEQQSTKSIFAEYWTTNGVLANNIKAGQKFRSYSGANLQEKTMINMLATTGGREKPKAEERIYAYREALLSRNRVVTTQDIKALCYKHFGQALDKVEVSKGVITDPSTNTGFVRTIDVQLSPSVFEDRAVSKDEWEFLCEDLKVKLKERASSVYPFRVVSLN
ncbi:type VI secretion system baseplate subunit TssF [Xanthovirga aplysinae]|uniref:type VI secretion system baseplate subunit TssF n=1 Tax=Xanthovirga aplysinae TaxID=2529853 RepID=UPI0012BD6EEB|nr:type VI secretion system baseplate subunit TssF [Xanthovirga aplysinae]MTI31218.1 hypothetical protein [Xanthovirga aplysinae]